MSENDHEKSANGVESPALLSALVTEHFALQSAASSTIGESGSRASIYLAALSSGLVAIGFSSSSPAVLAVIASTVFPTIFILGLFTVVRLIDTSIANVVALQRIESIRRFYLELHPRAAEFFPYETGPRARSLGVRYSGWSILFTTASMITVVNAVLAGATAALLLAMNGVPGAVAVGIIVGVVILLALLWYQARRFAPVLGDA